MGIRQKSQERFVPVCRRKKKPNHKQIVSPPANLSGFQIFR